MLDSYRGGTWKLVLEKNYSYYSDDGLHFPFICEYNQNKCVTSHHQERFLLYIVLFGLFMIVKYISLYIVIRLIFGMYQTLFPLFLFSLYLHIKFKIQKLVIYRTCKKRSYYFRVQKCLRSEDFKTAIKDGILA